eukprot:9472048-Pyramimonas_sp.AAC.1
MPRSCFRMAAASSASSAFGQPPIPQAPPHPPGPQPPLGSNKDRSQEVRSWVVPHLGPEAHD